MFSRETNSKLFLRKLSKGTVECNVPLKPRKTLVLEVHFIWNSTGVPYIQTLREISLRAKWFKKILDWVQHRLNDTSTGSGGENAVSTDV